MNLKRTLFTAISAVALSLSLVAQVALADDVITNASVQDGGQLYYDFWYSSMTFAPATITTYQSQTVAESSLSHRPLTVNDSRTSSPGYTLQISVTTVLTNGSYTIANQNLQILAGGGNGPLSPGYSCLDGGLRAANPVVGGNNYQSVTTGPSSTVWTPLDGTVALVTGGAGRGCGGIGPSGQNTANGGYQANYKFQLTVPAGSAAGNYTGALMVTEMGAQPN